MKEMTGDIAQEAWKRAELLSQLWLLDARLDSKTVVKTLAPMPRAEIVADPEIAFLLARNLRMIGAREQALSIIEDMADACAALGNTRLTRRRAFLEAALRFEFGKTDEAHNLLLAVLEDSRRAGDTFTEAMATQGLGIHYSLQCRFPEALSLFQRATVLTRKTSAVDMVYTLVARGTSFRELGMFEDAEACYLSAESIAAGLTHPQFHVYACMMRAHLVALRGETRLASEMARMAYESLDRQATPPDLFIESDLLYVRGAIARLDGRLQDARELLTQALDLAATPGIIWIRADASSEMAKVEAQAGNPEAALAFASTAERLFEQIGSPARAARVRLELEALESSRSAQSRGKM